MIETFVTGNVGSVKLTTKEKNEKGEGFAVLTFSVASHSKDSEGKEITNWVTCKVWGARGLALSKHIVQGQAVSVMGRPEAKTFPSENGTMKTDLVVHVDKFEFAGAKPKSLEGQSKEAYEF
jgi:single-stranded DNA-binding protein